MQWSDIQFKPPRKTLRQFAVLWIAFFGGFALWQYFMRGNPALAAVFAVLALVIGPLGLVRPHWMQPVYVSWMVLAFPIGWTISHLILAVMFYALFAPIGLFFRLIGRDRLHRALRPETETYWVPKPTPTNLRRYFQQF
jgi:hypothetical protein